MLDQNSEAANVRINIAETADDQAALAALPVTRPASWTAEPIKRRCNKSSFKFG